MSPSAPGGRDHCPQWRLPGEFEPQQALIVAWPHAGTDWALTLDAIRQELSGLIQAVLAHQPVIVLTDPSDPDPLPSAWVDAPGLQVVTVPFDDTWCRDYAPITLVAKGRRCFLDFQFTGWGKYPDHANDNAVANQLVHHPDLADWFDPMAYTPCALVLEGGAIESNGQGSVLVNAHCLRARLPDWTTSAIEKALTTHLNVHQVLSIDIPPLPGDDTDGHIDTLARFVDDRTLVVQTHPDAQTHQALLQQLAELSINLPQGAVKPRIIELPCPPTQGPWPKNYANFIMINGAVLVPAYGLATDQLACAVVQSALPNRDIISVEANALVTQLGGPHCTSMHIPQPDQ